MANNKSAKKRVLQNEKRRVNNCARRSAIKTAVKKVLAAVEAAPTNDVSVLFNDAQAKIARAKGKNLLHRNTAARKISRLAKRINKAKAAALEVK
ncbi:30S ribosomal protein S20 [Candidatus Babeliales bacterium]|nr:30S ribosomal protein S20 [Candidatus Babeliales bacterium]MBP9844334.1 30S ribosomal protein S20 [Candidatus Babeliales bacterium]